MPGTVRLLGRCLRVPDPEDVKAHRSMAMQEWKEELAGMAGRIKSMRTKLHEALHASAAPGNWDHVINQIGMFSFTGLTPAQVRLACSPDALPHLHLPQLVWGKHHISWD